MTNPQSLNRYSYVQNDPVNFIDPSGLDGIVIDTGPAVVVVATLPGVTTSGAGWLSTLAGLGGGGSLLDEISPGESIGGGGQGPTGPWVDPATVTEPPPPNPLYCLEDVIKAMKEAYSMTSNGTRNGEAAFTVERVGDNFGPSKITFSLSSPTDGMAATLNVTITPNTVALFHVHPNSGTAYPSGRDPAIARGDATVRPSNAKQPFPVYTMGSRGLWGYDPSSKKRQPELLRPNLDWTKSCSGNKK